MTVQNAAAEPATGPVLRLTRRFAAPREAVFDAFAQPEELARWFGPEGVSVSNVKIDLRTGGGYSMDFNEKGGGVHSLSGIYREIRPPERLVFTWVWGHGQFAGMEMLVTIELREADGGTELTLIHEALPSEDARDLHNQGWTSTLDCLDQLFARGEAS
jgi:uncharacterized protein YndB with AHSA1/START domain